jgi:predicted transcriptional regulator of viral defense system
MKQTAVNLIKLLQDHNMRVFTTPDVVTLSKLTPNTASQALRRLASQRLLVSVKRGVWVNTVWGDVNPFEVVPYLRSPWPAYISLYSALAEYGIIAEIPHAIYAVTSAPSAVYQTSIGSFRFHHLPAHLMWGYEMKRAGRTNYPMADREKAFLDLIYLALIPRSPLQFPYKRTRRWPLDLKKLRSYALQFKYKPLKDYLRRNMPGVFGQ